MPSAGQWTSWEGCGQPPAGMRVGVSVQAHAGSERGRGQAGATGGSGGGRRAGGEGALPAASLPAPGSRRGWSCSRGEEGPRSLVRSPWRALPGLGGADATSPLCRFSAAQTKMVSCPSGLLGVGDSGSLEPRGQEHRTLKSGVLILAVLCALVCLSAKWESWSPSGTGGGCPHCCPAAFAPPPSTAPQRPRLPPPASSWVEVRQGGPCPQG